MISASFYAWTSRPGRGNQIEQEQTVFVFSQTPEQNIILGG